MEVAKIASSLWMILVYISTKGISLQYWENPESGKSTLLHILGALDRYDEGDYFLDGQDMNQCSDKELAKIRNDSIGLVMQDFALLGDKTVIFNVMLPMFFDHTPFKDMKRLAEIALQETGISNLKNKKVNQLSGGQKQRVSIARAIVKRPMLILADEPTGALDSKTGIEIMDMLSNLNKEGIYNYRRNPR